MRRLLAGVLLCASCASSERTLVARATATQNYYTAVYEHRCVGTGAPPTNCQPCREVINDGVWKLKVANTNSQLGYLPPAEKWEIEQLITALEACHK